MIVLITHVVDVVVVVVDVVVVVAVRRTGRE